MSAGTMHRPALRVSGLTKTFTLHNQGGAQLQVLRNVDFVVYPGECVVLDGPSGVGKSSLLKLIHASYLASSGSISIDEGGQSTDVTKATPRELMRLRRDVIGYVSQFLRTVPRVAAIDVVAEPLIEEAGDSLDRAREALMKAEGLLRRLRIPARLWQVPPATFSGGEQQRVNIARGFIRRKPVLLLDEPTASLDTDNRITVTAMINEARMEGAAIVGIFHDARVREAVATRTYDMRQAQ
jgi:alpha-D-ribose 1-methylphosphonate 5-triphosphate synthase subunit PhnL